MIRKFERLLSLIAERDSFTMDLWILSPELSTIIEMQTGVVRAMNGTINSKIITPALPHHNFPCHV